MLTMAFGESTSSQKCVYKWYKCFTEAREDVNIMTMNVLELQTRQEAKHRNKKKKIVLKNRQITIREVTRVIGISIGSCHAIFSIFSDVLGMKSACSSEACFEIAEL